MTTEASVSAPPGVPQVARRPVGHGLRLVTAREPAVGFAECVAHLMTTKPAFGTRATPAGAPVRAGRWNGTAAPIRFAVFRAGLGEDSAGVPGVGYEIRLKSSLQPSGAATAMVYGDFLHLEGAWNPYGLRMAGQLVGVIR